MVRRWVVSAAVMGKEEQEKGSKNKILDDKVFGEWNGFSLVIHWHDFGSLEIVRYFFSRSACVLVSHGFNLGLVGRFSWENYFLLF